MYKVDDQCQYGEEQESHDGQGGDQTRLSRNVGAAEELELLAPAAFVTFITPGGEKVDVDTSATVEVSQSGDLVGIEVTHTQVSVFMAAIL